MAFSVDVQTTNDNDGLKVSAHEGNQWKSLGRAHNREQVVDL